MTFQEFLKNDYVPFSLLSVEIGVGKTYFSRYRKLFVPETKKIKRFVGMSISTAKDFLEKVISSKCRKKDIIRKFLESLLTENKIVKIEVEKDQKPYNPFLVYDQTKYGHKINHIDFVSKLRGYGKKSNVNGDIPTYHNYGLSIDQKIDMNTFSNVDNHLENYTRIWTFNGKDYSYLFDNDLLDLNLQSLGELTVSPILDYVKYYFRNTNLKEYENISILGDDMENFEMFKINEVEKYKELQNNFKRNIIIANREFCYLNIRDYALLNDKIEEVFIYLKDNKDERLISEENRPYLKYLFNKDSLYSEFNLYYDLEGNTQTLRRYYIEASNKKMIDKIESSYHSVVDQLSLFNYLNIKDAKRNLKKTVEMRMMSFPSEDRRAGLKEACDYYNKYMGENFILGQYEEVPYIAKRILNKYFGKIQ